MRIKGKDILVVAGGYGEKNSALFSVELLDPSSVKGWVKGIQILKLFCKDLFDRTLYPYVLKIKTIIVVKQNFAKMPFIYYLQIHIWLLCGLDVLASE